jgi:hypothetical protein
MQNNIRQRKLEVIEIARSLKMHFSDLTSFEALQVAVKIYSIKEVKTAEKLHKFLREIDILSS